MTRQVEPRLPVYYSDPEAEADLLDRLVVCPEELAASRAIVKPDMLRNEQRRAQFASLCRAADAGAVLANGGCVEAMLEDLNERGDLEAAGGHEAIYHLGARMLAFPAAHYAERIARHLPNRQAALAWAELEAAFRTTEAQANPSAFVERAYERLAEHRRQDAGNISGKRRPYIVLTDEEAEALKPASGIVGDILFEDSSAYLYSVKDSWKTFLAVSWACAVATGRDWLGQKTVQGPVVYVSAEGARGIGQRIAAWKRWHGVTGSIDVLVVPMPVNLLDPAAIPQLMAAIDEHIDEHSHMQGRKPALIVFDTLARSMDRGNENETPDANAITAAAGRLKAAYGACVLIVHHSGYSAPGRMRGNSALAANADIVLRIIAPAVDDGQRRKPGSVITLHCQHTKETEPFEDIKLTTALKTWSDDDGESHNSLVLVAPDSEQLQAESARVSRTVAQLTVSQRKAIAALCSAPSGLTAANFKRASGLSHSTFYNVLSELIEQRYAEKRGNDTYHATDEARALFPPDDTSNHPAQSNGHLDWSNGPVGLAT